MWHAHYRKAPWSEHSAKPWTLELKARDVLRFATVEGAKALRLDEKVGSLTPGKQADIVLLRSDSLNMFPPNDPVASVVLCAHAGDVDTVLVAGKVVKKDGQLIGFDLAQMRKQLAESRDHILSQASLPETAQYKR